MKKLFFIAALFTGVLFTSCVKDLLDVNFGTTITNVIPVAVLPGTVATTQNTDFSLDANADTKKYLNKLKSIEIKKMTYKIKDFATGGDATGKVGIKLMANNALLYSVDNVVAKTSSDAMTVYEVTDKAALKTAAASLLQNKKITLQSEYKSDSKTTMNFNVEVMMELGVVANPL